MDGGVTAFLSGGSLVITGDAEANNLVITADPNDPGHVTLSAGDGNTLINNNLGDVEFTFTYDLRVSLADGDDVLSIVGDGGPGSVVPRDLLIDLGNADAQNQFNLTGGYSIGRNFRTLAKAGEDILNIDTIEAFDAYFALGNDGGDIVLSNATLTRGISVVYGNSGANINGFHGTGITTGFGVTIQGGLGTNEVVINDSDIGGTLFIRAAGTTNTEDIGNNDGGDVTIGGSLFIMNTSGTNTVLLDSVSVAQTTSIRNGNGDNANAVVNSGFEGSFTSVGGLGTNVNQMFDSFVDRAASFSGAAGTNVMQADGVQFDGQLVVTHGGGTSGVVILGVGQQVNVNAQTTIRQGNTTDGNLVVATQVVANASFYVQNGNGGANVIIGAPGDGTAFSTTGTLSVKNGNALGGATNFVSVDNADIGIDLAVVNGNTEDTNTIRIGVDVPVNVGEDLLARNGNGGTSEVTLNAVTITNTLIITGGSGDDTVLLESIGTGDLTVGGSTTIDLLGGSDTLNVGINTAGSAIFTGYFSARMGNDDDTVTIGEGSVFVTDQNFLFDGGFGTDSIEVTNGVAFDPFDPLNASRIKNFELITT